LVAAPFGVQGIGRNTLGMSRSEAPMTVPVWSFLPERASRLFAALVPIFTALLFSSQLALAQFTQQGPKLFGNDAVGNAYQGNSVSLSADGNTALVGGYRAGP
jgi:hypothetical protein